MVPSFLQYATLYLLIFYKSSKPYVFFSRHAWGGLITARLPRSTLPGAKSGSVGGGQAQANQQFHRRFIPGGDGQRKRRVRVGSQIKLVVGAGIVAQTVGQAKPPQRKTAELSSLSPTQAWAKLAS